MPEETDKKLGMSLDELIRKRKNSDATAKRTATDNRKNVQHGSRQAQMGRGLGPQDGFARGPPRGYQGNVLNGRPQNIPQQAFTNTGLIMPNFGMPFGNFPAPSMQTGMARGPTNGFNPLMGGAPLPPGMMPPSMLNPDAQPFTPTPPLPPQTVAVPQARLEPVSGEVRVSFRKQDIVRISKEGNMVLDTKGFRGPAMFMALNGILKIANVSITRPKNAKPEDGWSVSDGRSLTRFSDGMTIPGRGYDARTRGKKILDAFGEVDPSAAAAATAASDAAARAAGIFPKAPHPASSDRIHGLHPRAQMRSRNDADEPTDTEEPLQSGGVGGKSPAEQDRIRRLNAKGRYRPY